MNKVNYDIKTMLINIVQDTLKVKVNDASENLFDLFSAHDLLNLINPIEASFKINFFEIIINGDHSVMSVDNITQRIKEILNV